MFEELICFVYANNLIVYVRKTNICFIDDNICFEN